MLQHFPVDFNTFRGFQFYWSSIRRKAIGDFSFRFSTRSCLLILKPRSMDDCPCQSTKTNLRTFQTSWYALFSPVKSEKNQSSLSVLRSKSWNAFLFESTISNIFWYCSFASSAYFGDKRSYLTNFCNTILDACIPFALNCYLNWIETAVRTMIKLKGNLSRRCTNRPAKTSPTSFLDVTTLWSVELRFAWSSFNRAANVKRLGFFFFSYINLKLLVKRTRHL